MMNEHRKTDRPAACLVCVLISVAYFSQANSLAQTPQHRRVYLTHLKTWLAGGDFEQKSDSRSRQSVERPSYLKEFQKVCAPVILTGLEHADYAVAIDDKKFLSGLSGHPDPKAAKFQYEVYSRDLGQIFAGGENLLTNAIQKACDAVTSPNPSPLGREE